MAAVDNPLFAEEDFSLFAGVGGFTAPSHRGWHGNKALVPPSPVFGTNETNETNPHRGETKRTRDSGTSSKARALARRNDHLEAELASLRTRSSLETTQSAKTKANALRHLKAVEEHVGLLVNESNAKLETLVAEREKENALDFDERDENESDVMRRRGRTNGEARETSTRHTGDTGNNHGSAACAETERLRDELVRFSNREAEMDAEAEERESELAQAVKRIESLTQALRNLVFIGKTKQIGESPASWPTHPTARTVRAALRPLAMQFLEQQLNKVDALAAEVIPARRGSGYDESMEDLLTRDPGAVATASGVQALGLRLGLGSNRDGHQVKGGYEPEDVLDETSDPVVRAQRGKLAALVAALVVLEEKARTAKAARDGSITAATEAETVRAREAADAKEQHVALQRDIESETQELTQVATEAARRERDALGGDEGDFHDALLRATALAANRNEDARGMEKRAAELSAEAKVLEEACLSAALDEKETQKASAETSTSTSKTLLRRAETARLRLEVSAATQDLATLLGEETVRRAARSSQAVSSSHRTRKHTEETTADLQKSAESLAAQLLSRRLETQTLAREKLALEQAVAEALMERRRVTREHSVASDSGSAVSGGGLKRRAPGESERPLKASARKGGRAGVRQRVASAARRVDKIGIRAGRHLSRSGGWRSLALLYALGLHVFAFCVLAWRALSAGPELKPIER